MASVPLKETFYKPFLYETERANDSFDPPFQIKKKNMQIKRHFTKIPKIEEYYPYEYLAHKERYS